MQKRWWIPLMILACLLWAVSCAQKGAEEVMGIGVRPAAAGSEEPVVVEEAEADHAEEADPAEEAGPEKNPGAIPPDGMRHFRVAGEGKELTDCSRPPELTVAGCAKAAHPSCTWTADGATMIACGMAPLDMLDLLENVPYDPSEAELLFEVEPDRTSLRFALLKWDGNGTLLTNDDDFIEREPNASDGTYHLPGSGHRRGAYRGMGRAGRIRRSGGLRLPHPRPRGIKYKKNLCLLSGGSVFFERDGVIRLCTPPPPSSAAPWRPRSSPGGRRR